MPINNNIIIVESSQIICEGLAGILTKLGSKQQVYTTQSLEGMELLTKKMVCNLIIINPSFFQSNIKAFNSLKNHHKNIRFIGLIYAYFEENLLTKFDAQITISDTNDSIYTKINKLQSTNEQQEKSSSQNILSNREIDVLKLLATGLSNKEIGDKLNISIHTVISHRKNITQKTSIKSVSGLTIYAVVQKLITTESISL